MAKYCCKTLVLGWLLLILGGCSIAELSAPTPLNAMFQSPLPLPGHVAYVLAGRPSGSIAQLTLLDADTWQVLRTIQLPQVYTTHLSRDPLGRLWIGYEGNDWVEYRMQVYAPDGRLLRTLRPCRHPNSGVQFSGERAFIICLENGFFGPLAVVNLKTLAIEDQVKLAVPDEVYFIYSSGGDSQQTLVLGIIHRSGGTDSNAIMFIDPQSRPLKLHLQRFDELDTLITGVLPYQGKYYLLNTVSSRAPRELAQDILVVTSGESIISTTITTPVPSPTWGKIIGDVLFTYHNPAALQSSETPRERAISRLDLKTAISETWALPDNWDANDMEVIDGKIILVRDDGIYEFNLENSQLRKVVDIPFAKQIIVTP